MPVRILSKDMRLGRVVGSLEPVASALSGTFDAITPRTGIIQASPAITVSASLRGTFQTTPQRNATISAQAVSISALIIANAPAWVPAAVQLYDASGAAAGYGPSDDPEGVFYGQTVNQGDIWAVTSQPDGAVVQPLPGGSFRITIAPSMATGSYSFTYEKNGVPASKAFTVT